MRPGGSGQPVGIEVESVVDAREHPMPLFLCRPETRVRLEYVEHRPTFSLV